MTNLQKLETAIREALPELMEFSYGVEVRHTRKRDGQSITLRPSVIPDIKPEEWEIIGHPVTILDLLRWLDIVLNNEDKYYSTDMSLTGVISVKEYDNNRVLIFRLDLSKPLLSQQSQDVIDELVKFVK